MAGKNGAERLVESSIQAGIELCFANPGTTEMHLLKALDENTQIRAVLGLFEGVCTGAADGYARMQGRPAATLLHLGPGLANGIANLHNARRAHTPVVNWVGDHASWHLAADAPLTSDIESLAGTVGWVRKNRGAASLAADGQGAIRAALGPPGRPASLVIPADSAWGEAPSAAEAEQGAPPAPATPAQAEEAALREAAAQLGKPGACLFLGGTALCEAGLTAARQIAEACSCLVLVETFAARLTRGGGLPHFARLPYFPEAARDALAQVEHLVLVGAPDPVAFFGYPGQPSRLTPEKAQVLTLAAPGDDAVFALQALAEMLGAKPALPAKLSAATPARGALTPASLGQTLAALLPENAIVVDEAATSGLPFSEFAAGGPRHDVLGLTGGAIGMGLPCALGAAIACPEQPVIAFQADGSALYTLQALWSMAREGSNVTVIICANRAYRILQAELGRAGVANPGETAQRLTTLDAPPVDWTAAAQGFGVPAQQVDSAEGFADALQRAVDAPGPKLVEALLP